MLYKSRWRTVKSKSRWLVNHTVKNKSCTVWLWVTCSWQVNDLFVTHSKEQVAVVCKSHSKEQVMYCVTATRRDCDLSRTSYWLVTNESLDSSHVLCDCDSSWLWLVVVVCLIHMCNTTHFYVWHRVRFVRWRCLQKSPRKDETRYGSFTCVTRLISMCDTAISFLCVTPRHRTKRCTIS